MIHAMTDVHLQNAKVAVLMGGRSMERDISMLSGTGVLNALKQKGIQALAFDPANRPLQDLVNEHFTPVSYTHLTLPTILRV